MERSHWRKSHLGIYKGLTWLNFMPFKHIFGAQIENNMLENHADQREMVLLFSLLLLRWFFFSAWLLDKPQKDDKLRYYSLYLPLLLYRNVGLGILRGFFQGPRTGLKTCSIQMPWTCDVLERTFGLQEKHFLILFARLLFLLSSFFDTRTRTRQKQQRTCTSMFFKQNVTPLKIYHQRVCQWASVLLTHSSFDGKYFS